LTFLACHDRAPLDGNNAVARGLEIMADDIIPKLKWLKKGRDILNPFLRPYHFHDIVKNREEKGNNRESPGAAGRPDKKYCRLVLRYPGEEVDDIERIIKKRIAIEEYLYGIQRGEFIVVQINGGKNGSK
jgi:hypothetical protein